MTDKALNLLQFAAKAGRLSYGTHATEWALESGKARLVCVADDTSAKSIKEIKFKAAKRGVEVLILDGTDSEALSRAIGKRCGRVAVNDDSFAKAIIEKTGGTAHDGKI